MDGDNEEENRCIFYLSLLFPSLHGAFYYLSNANYVLGRGNILIGISYVSLSTYLRVHLLTNSLSTYISCSLYCHLHLSTFQSIQLFLYSSTFLHMFLFTNPLIFHVLVPHLYICYILYAYYRLMLLQNSTVRASHISLPFPPQHQRNFTTTPCRLMKKEI